MKMIVAVVCALVAVAAAAPPAEEVAQILRSDFKHDDKGGYEFGYEDTKGASRQELGEVVEILDEENKPHQVVIVRGSYAYPDESGKPITVNYVADQNGYQAEGDSIPKVQTR